MPNGSPDRGGLDRVLLISSADIRTRSSGSRFDPRHPVFYRTEGTDPVTYSNRFCRMRLNEDGSVGVRRLAPPDGFAERWEALFRDLEALKTVRDLHVYDFGMREAPAAVALTTYGRVRILGNGGRFDPARSWQGALRVYWDEDGFGALCDDDCFRAVGALEVLDGIGDVQEVVCSALPGRCTPVAYILQKNGAVSLFDRKNRSIARPRERVQQISLVRYNPHGVSTWVALSKITGRFLSSEPRDSISGDFFGGDYTEIIAPNRFRMKILAIASVPTKYLAVLYENGYLRVFGAGFNNGDILCEDVRSIELSGDELVAFLPSDLSFAPAIEFNEDGGGSEDALRRVELGAAADLPAALALLGERVKGWIGAEKNRVPVPFRRIRAARRNDYYVFLLLEDGSVRAERLNCAGESGFHENDVALWENVREVLPGRFHTLGLTNDGRVLSAGHGYGAPYRLDGWDRVRELRQSGGLAAALREDGTVLTQRADSGVPVPGTETWRHVRQIEVGDDFVAALFEDGRVDARGSDSLAGLDFRRWRGIRKIAVAGRTIAGLTDGGRVLVTGKTPNHRFDRMTSWEGVGDLISFQHGGTLFLGLRADGSVLSAGRWNRSDFLQGDNLDHEKWSGLRSVSGDGYYLVGERTDGTVVHESTPSEKAGAPPMDEHITDWSDVVEYIIADQYLLARREDGTVAWEGGRRSPEKRARTAAWRNIEQIILWNTDAGGSVALAADRDGVLHTDLVATGFNPVERQAEIDAFFGRFRGVRKMLLFMPFLAVLHEKGLSFVSFEDGVLSRIDLADAADILSAEEGDTLVIVFGGGDVRSVGRTVYHSAVDPASEEVRFYGDRSEYAGGAEDPDPFRHFEGILGVDPSGRPFVLSPGNLRESENFYALRDLIRLDGVRGAVSMEPRGDILMRDGTCRSKRGSLFEKWVGIRQLSSCPTHAIGVTAFNTLVVKGDGEYGSCSVDAYMGVRQAFSLPHATVLLLDNGRLLSLCEKLSETPYEPLPAVRDVAMIAKTGSHFAILTKGGALWYCEAQASADKIRWRGSSDYYTRPWGPWKKLCDDAVRMTCVGEAIRIWRREQGFSYREPTVEQEALSGREPSLG